MPIPPTGHYTYDLPLPTRDIREEYSPRVLQKMRNREEYLRKMEANRAKSAPGSIPVRPDQTIYIGERGGRYYKRTRPDGTTYREYTY